jgi:hypothetical protein
VTLEQILVVAIFVLVPLLNVLLRALRRRLAGPPPREPGPEAPGMPARVPVPFPAPGAPRAEAGGIRPRVPPPLPEALRPRRRPQARIASAREARRAIVLMAVLGPCRGLEPPGPAGTGPVATRPVATRPAGRGGT